MLGINRFGRIAKSFLVAELTRRQFAFSAIFSVVAVAGLVAAIALVVKGVAGPRPGEARSAGREALGH